jgi:hypothetical protein
MFARDKKYKVIMLEPHGGELMETVYYGLEFKDDVCVLPTVPFRRPDGRLWVVNLAGPRFISAEEHVISVEEHV